MNKAANGNIPVKMLKESGFIFLYLVNCINEGIMNCEFPDPLKSSNIVPVCKRNIN